MIWKMFSVYDSGAKVFLQPFFVRHEQEALRAVSEAGMDSKTAVGKYPAEFVFYGLGTFDDTTGIVEMFPALNSYGPVSGLIAAVTKAE